MKQSLPLLAALGVSLLTGGYLLGQAGSSITTAGAAAAKPQRLVRVSTLKTVEQNREFQANVNLVQQQRQAAIELNTAMEKAPDAKKKAEIKQQLDAMLAKLTDNNEKMQKAYGFSLTRNYNLEIEVAHIYMIVTEEEAVRFEKAAAEAAKKK
jgi:hypothetical protein